jgi:hypothetical protein
MRISSIGLIAAVSLGLGGCAYNGLGMGVGTGYGYNDYGYGYGYSPYGYSPYAYNGYGSPYGWYNGYYYPGTGGWVYDRDGHRREILPGELFHFERQAKEFRQRMIDTRRAGTSTSTTTSRGTAVTTTSRVREPARTRVIERSTERPRATSSSRRALRVLRDKKDD